MMGMPKAKPSEAPEEGGELEDAMSDLGEALADKDWGAAASAFKRAHTICAGYEDEPDEE